MSKRWFCSDTHFNHDKDFIWGRRGYSSVSEMNESMIMGWNEKVSDVDLVYHLGDFAAWSVRSVFHFRNQLKGKIILTPGNHCPCFGYWKSEKKERVRQEYLQNGFTDVQKSVILTLKGDKEYVCLLNHFPPNCEEQKQYDDRYWEDREEYNEEIIFLHGHTHHRHYLKNKNMIDISWESKPGIWSEEEIIQIIEDPREFIF